MESVNFVLGPGGFSARFAAVCECEPAWNRFYIWSSVESVTESDTESIRADNVIFEIAQVANGIF